MAHGNDPRYDERDPRNTQGERARVAPLKELDDFDVARDEPDIRGWKVHSADKKEIGKVKELIADTGAMKVRYLDIELDRKVFDLKNDRHVLVPVGAARLNDDDDEVIINRPSADFATLPEYEGGRIDRDYEERLQRTWGSGSGATAGSAGGGDYYEQEHFNDREFFGKRRQGRENASYLTRSEEELRVGKRAQRAGEVGVHKSVETEHVSESVPVRREEATVERRPATGRQASGKIGEDEVRVPLMEEEPVVEKRAVPKEEVVIRKHVVEDEKQVEADLKKERVNVDKKGATDRNRERR